MYDQTTLEIINNVTSLPVLGGFLWDLPVRAFPPASISGQAASPARTYRLPESARAWLESGVDSGLNLPVLFAVLGQDGLWWRTSEDCFQVITEPTSELFSQTWPHAGMMQSGKLYRRPVSALHNLATESLLLPTMRVRGFCGGSGAKGKLIRLFGEKYGTQIFNGGNLSPEFCENVMGFPVGWTELDNLETQ